MPADELPLSKNKSVKREKLPITLVIRRNVKVPVILGIVINSHLFKPLQPSMDAASYSSCGMDCIPAKFMSIL